MKSTTVGLFGIDTAEKIILVTTGKNWRNTSIEQNNRSFNTNVPHIIFKYVPQGKNLFLKHCNRLKGMISLSPHTSSHFCRSLVLCCHYWVHNVVWVWSMEAQKTLGGSWPRMLKKAIDERMIMDLYQSIAARRLRFNLESIGTLCERHPELGTHRFILWESTYVVHVSTEQRKTMSTS